MYMTGSAADSPGYMPSSAASLSAGTTQFSGFQPPINVSNPLGSPAFMANNTASPASTGGAPPASTPHTANGDGAADTDEGIDDPKLHEAMKLVQYVIFSLPVGEEGSIPG